MLSYAYKEKIQYTYNSLNVCTSDHIVPGGDADVKIHY